MPFSNRTSGERAGGGDWRERYTDVAIGGMAQLIAAGCTNIKARVRAGSGV